MPAPLVDADGRPVELGARLGTGGEGTVHEIRSDPSRAAKVLFPKGRNPEAHDKIRSMIARPPPGAREPVWGFPVLTWPATPLYEGSRRTDAFVGYTMPRIDARRDFVPLYHVLTGARRRQLGGLPITWDRLLVLGLRISHVVRTLHGLRYAVGDLNDRNLLVSRRLTPLFLDTDSFEVPRGWFGHYACRVGDRLYWPPEFLGLDLSRYRGSRIGGDRYALAVLLFQLLMNGMRPYQCRGRLADREDSMENKTRTGLYPWVRPRRGVLEPPRGAPRYDLLPEGLRRGFEEAFVGGHDAPRLRPTADDWHRILRREIEAGFLGCPRRAAHRYSAQLSRCPWCADRHDPFSA